MCFLFIGHHHQILHAAPVAAAMARSGTVDVHVAASSEAHLSIIRSYVDALGGAPMRYRRLWPDAGRAREAETVPPKVLVLLKSLPWLSGFDAIVTPERTSLLLKKLGLKRPLFIHTDHGAGDRAVGYEKRIAEFDFTLVAGQKQRERMAAASLIREGAHAVVGYPKFDLADALAGAAPALFADQRPTVLYNPHFRRGLGSWSRFGREVLERFAASPDYNLIFAPHMRLFEEASRRELAEIEAYGRASNIHVDLGSSRSCDMTYTNAADLYLGDVSSQVYEFIRTPRACLFLNAHGVDWRGDENYGHWAFGPVLDRVDDLTEQVAGALAGRAAYAPAQSAGFAHTFDLSGRSSDRAAAAILTFLASEAARARTAAAPSLPDWLLGDGLPVPAEP